MTTQSKHHIWTPTLAIREPRGWPARTTHYYRRSCDEALQPRSERRHYDSLGRLIAQRDARLGALIDSDPGVPFNLVSRYAVSGQVLNTQSVDAGWRVVLMDEAGQTLRSWDSRGNQSRLEHDALLRPIAVFEQPADEPERCVERLRYGSTDSAASNLCGQLIEHDDTAGRRQICQLAVTGGVLKHSRRFLANEEVLDWPPASNDGEALLETGAAASSCTHFNALGESIAEIDAKGHRRHFRHTVAGHLKNTSMQLAGQTERTLLSSIHYSAYGQVEEETAGNGVRTWADYSPVDGRLDRLRAGKPGGPVMQDLTYTYDPVGNILSIRDDAQPVRHFNNQRIEPVNTYRYDTLYQLIEAMGRESASPSHGPALPGMMPTPVDPNQLANYTQTFTYDAGGNLTTLRHVGARSFTREMDVAVLSNRSVIKGELDLATAFDGNGNLLQLQPGQRLEWDARNQLRQVTPVQRDGMNDDYERYTYDASGARVRKKSSTQARSVTHSAEVRYLPGLELRTDSATGETLQIITASAGLTGVRALHWETGKPDKIDNFQVRYTLVDHLGSSTLELDSLGAVISLENYYPYGGTAWRAGRSATEVSHSIIRYSGKERDATGLYYYGIRYYAPWLQRWIDPDPWGAIDGLNIYRFTGNNPIGNVDEEGGVLTPAHRQRLSATILEQIAKPRSLEMTLITPTEKFHKQIRKSLVGVVKELGGKTKDAEEIFDEARKTHENRVRQQRQVEEDKRREKDEAGKAESLRQDRSRALGYIYSTNTGQARIKEGLKIMGLATGVTGTFGSATNPVQEIDEAFGSDMLDKDTRSRMKLYWERDAEYLAKSFLDSRDFSPGLNLIRGDTRTVGTHLDAAIAANQPYTAPTVLSAAREEHVARKYQTGTMLEMSGEAALVESMYGEHEYVFRPGARFSVSKIGAGRYRLRQI